VERYELAYIRRPSRLQVPRLNLARGYHVAKNGPSMAPLSPSVDHATRVLYPMPPNWTNIRAAHVETQVRHLGSLSVWRDRRRFSRGEKCVAPNPVDTTPPTNPRPG
jgi:hypothetical protein